MILWPIAASAAAAAGFAWAAVHPRSQIFGPVVHRTADPRTLALTFDDGPNPGVTPALLDLLARHNVCATFFLIGRYVSKQPAIAADIVRAGHLLGNHTHTHQNLTWLPSQRIRGELDACRSVIGESAGVETRWVRPPWGFRGPQFDGVVRSGGFGRVAMWSRLAWDWHPQPPGRLIERLGRVRGGEIVLLHDGDWQQPRGDRAHVVAALQHWLPRWLDAGQKFVTLDEL